VKKFIKIFYSPISQFSNSPISQLKILVQVSRKDGLDESNPYKSSPLTLTLSPLGERGIYIDLPHTFPSREREIHITFWR